MTGRYDAAGNVEAQFEPGSNGRVLANKLGVSDVEEMDKGGTDYFAAVQAGMSDYGPMKGLVRRVLRAAAGTEDA